MKKIRESIRILRQNLRLLREFREWEEHQGTSRLGERDEKDMWSYQSQSDRTGR